MDPTDKPDSWWKVFERASVLSERLDEIAIPDSIQDVLMARIDRLDSDAKLAIQNYPLF